VSLELVAKRRIHALALRSGHVLRSRVRCSSESSGEAVDPVGMEECVSPVSGEEAVVGPVGAEGVSVSVWALPGRVMCDSPVSGRVIRFCHMRERLADGVPPVGEEIIVDRPSGASMELPFGDVWALVSQRNPTPPGCVADRCRMSRRAWA
jgi:hypothetical protein